MSTSGERALRAAAAANTNRGVVINPSQDTDRAQRLATVEAAAA